MIEDAPAYDRLTKLTADTEYIATHFILFVYSWLNISLQVLL